MLTLRSTAAALTALCAIAGPASAAVGFQAREVYKGDTTIKDQVLSYPSTGQPEVTSMLVEISAGGESDRHQHPTPPYIYVLEGTMTIEFDDGSQRSFAAGRGFLEAANIWHKARNLSNVPLRFVVVFLGEKGRPNFVRP